MRRAALAALGAWILTACFSLEAPARQERVRALLAESEVPLVVDPRTLLAFVTVESALTLSSGFEEGERLRARFALPSPTPGFAEAFVAALREQSGLAASAFEPRDLGASQDPLVARGPEPVFFASTGSWRLYYDLSLHRYRMSVWLEMHVVPAAQVAAGRGALALPERLWRSGCTFRGPQSPQPLEAWEAHDGALLHDVLREAQQRCGRRVAERLVAFLERGEEQGAFDFGDLE